MKLLVLLFAITFSLGGDKKKLKNLEKIFDAPTIYVEHMQVKEGKKVIRKYNIKKTTKKILVEYTETIGHKTSRAVRTEATEAEVQKLKSLVKSNMNYQNSESCGTSDTYKINDPHQLTIKFTVSDCKMQDIIEWAQCYQKKRTK